jgi:HK97 family phage portal protein
LLDRVNARHAQRSADPVTLEEFDRILGQASGRQVQSRAGVAVSADRALGISAWYRGSRWLSETVASLPVHTYRKGPDGRVRRANPLWMDQPAPDLPWFGLSEFLMMSLIHRGNAFAYKTRNGSGQVVGLVPVHPDDVRFGVASGRKVFEIGRKNADPIVATTAELLHIPALSNDGYFGIDPIRAFANGLGTVAAADEYAARFYSNGANLAGYITLPGRLDEDDALRLKAQWDRLHKGLTHAHEFGVIGDGAEYHTIGLDAEQTQLLESRRFGVTEVARMLGVVPHKLYDLERATFSNIEHQAIEAVTDGIRPWVSRIEAWVNADRSLVIEQNYIEHELEGLLRGDIKTRYEAYAIATGGPWMEGNVPRRLENLPERPELDRVLQPMNYAVAGTEAETSKTRDLAVAEVLQKVYLAVTNGVISVEEARQIAVDAGATFNPQEVPTDVEA